MLWIKSRTTLCAPRCRPDQHRSWEMQEAKATTILCSCRTRTPTRFRGHVHRGSRLWRVELQAMKARSSTA